MNGEWVPIQKKPKTDDSKSSVAGYIKTHGKGREKSWYHAI